MTYLNLPPQFHLNSTALCFCGSSHESRSVFLKSHWSLFPREGRPGISDVSPLSGISGLSVWSQFSKFSSFVILPSPVARSVLSFSAFVPLILLTYFSLNLHFSKGRLFCVAFVVVLFLSGLGMSILVGGMCSILCCLMALVLAFMHLYSMFNLRLLLSILF